MGNIFITAFSIKAKFNVNIKIRLVIIADLFISLINNPTTKNRTMPIKINKPDIGIISINLASSIFRK